MSSRRMQNILKTLKSFHKIQQSYSNLRETEENIVLDWSLFINNNI